MVDSCLWPASLWRSAQKRAKGLGLTMDQYAAGVLSAAENPHAVVLAPENIARAQDIADIMGISLTKYVNWTLNSYLRDIHGGGRVMEIEIDNAVTFDSLAEARRVCRKAVAFDRKQTAIRFNKGMPRIWKDGDGDIWATYREEGK